jgi:DNA polymerase
MFIGEAPGWHEDQQGRPFVGPAGLYLDELLASINLKREQVYIANVIKCRPQGNRDPLPSEILNCRKWLERQIELIQPRIIVTLGRYSMAMFFPGKSIGKIHGTAQKRDNVIYYAMYHPAAALHQQSLRRTIGEDMLKIPSLLARAENVVEAKQQPQQLTRWNMKMTSSSLMSGLCSLRKKC